MKNINKAESFDEVVEIRNEIYLANLAGDNNFEDILIGLYKEETHFIYELLQNADDVNATEVKITLTPDELIFWHNGTKDFDLRNVIAITGIGATTKKDEVNKKGKFGIGFKSVFSITGTPRVYSGEFNFEIQHFSVPSRIPPIETVSGTTFVLPFNREDKSPPDVYKTIEGTLSQLDSSTVMFLDYISVVEWSSLDSSGKITKRTKANLDNCSRIGFYDASDELLSEYLVFSKPLSFDAGLSVSIAYKLGSENGNDVIIPVRNSKLCVYFLTETVTYLKFRINAPYQTTSTRESVDGNRQYNVAVTEEVARLYRQTLTQLKARGFINGVAFLSELPIDPDNCESSFLYSKLYDVTVDAIKHDKLLPTAGGGYCNSGDAALARTAELVKLLKKDDLRALFDRNTWLSTEITLDRTPALRSYLMSEHGVDSIDYAAFCRKLTKEYISSKKDEWLVRFYSESAGRTDTVITHILKEKPIVRVESGDNVPAYTGNKQNVYFPSPSIPPEKCIKRILAENRDTLRFFKGIGIEKANVTDEIMSVILPAFKKSTDTTERLKLISLIYKAYKDEEDATKDSIVSFMKNESIVLYEKASDNTLWWGPANLGYFRTDELHTLFDGCEDVYFVADKYFDDIQDSGTLHSFLAKLGVNGSLKRVECRQLDDSEKCALRNDTRATGETEINYDVHCLKYIFDNINEDRSRVLFKLLSDKTRDYFMGNYSWSYSHSYHDKDFKAYFVRALNSAPWLIGSEGTLTAAGNLTKQNIVDIYMCKDNAPVLEILELIPDVFDSLPDSIKIRLDLVREIPLSALEELRDKYVSKQKVEVEEQVIEEEPGTSESTIIDAGFAMPDAPGGDIKQDENADSDDNSGAAQSDDDEDYNVKKRVVIRTADNKSIVIGRWGELKVINSLMDKYRDKGFSISDTEQGFEGINADGDRIQLVNKNIGKVQRGYDFELYLNDEVIEFIEVKSRASEEAELFSISGLQWRKANELFSNGEGDKYVIYVVSSAGKASAKVIRYGNPVKNWRENKLYADPVRIRL